MKSSIKKLEPEFTPVSITFTIESQEELDALYELSRLNCSIPNLVYKYSEYRDEAKYKTLKEFLNSIYSLTKPCWKKLK